MQPARLLLALAAAAYVAGLAVAQAPAPSGAVVDPHIADPNWKDPNVQTEGFQAQLVPIATNPLGLKPAQVQREGADAPNAGVTFASQHNAEVSLDAENLWTWEFDGCTHPLFNVENVGLTTVYNLKDPSWPTVLTLFQTVSSPDYAPIINGDINKTTLDALAQGLTDAAGNELGYVDIMEAANGTVLGVVSRMAADPTQALFGVLGTSLDASQLSDAIGMPVDDETLIPLTDEEIAALPKPSDLKPAARRIRRSLAAWEEAR